MNAEGTLSIELGVARGRVARVAASSTRPVTASRVLAGRGPADVLRLVPLLFPVCGTAQGVACARAIEAATGRAVDPRVEAAREVACLAEAASSDLLQLALAWREAAQAAPDAEAAREGRSRASEIASALLGTEGAPTDAAVAQAARAAEALAATLETLASGDAPLVTAVLAADRADFGARSRDAAPSFDLSAVAARLAADPAFAARPDLAGAPLDATALAVASGPGEGRRQGLLGRLRARQTDARRHATELRARAATLRAGPAESANVRHAEGPGAGAGLAWTARGPLVHWVRVAGAQIADVRVVAPTDWTFHPDGVVREALSGAAARPTLARDAGWFVLALDPCVPWEVEVRDA